jgi:hypothetical protein
MLVYIAVVVMSALAAAPRTCTYPPHATAHTNPATLALAETCSPSSDAAGASLTVGVPTTQASKHLYVDTRRQVYDLSKQASFSQASTVKVAIIKRNTDMVNISASVAVAGKDPPLSLLLLWPVRTTPLLMMMVGSERESSCWHKQC